MYLFIYLFSPWLSEEILISEAVQAPEVDTSLAGLALGLTSAGLVVKPRYCPPARLAAVRARTIRPRPYRTASVVMPNVYKYME